MDESDAQSHEAQGVSFSVVVVHHILGLAKTLGVTAEDLVLRTDWDSQP